MSVLGGGIGQVAYRIRVLSVAGDNVFGSVVSNYMLLGLVIIPWFTILLVNNNIRFLDYTVISAPWIVFILLVAGRAGLVQLALVLFFLLFILNRRVSFKIFLFVFLFLFCVIVVGALATKKVNISEGGGIDGVINVFARHVADYAFQGPILFSRYLDGHAVVSENWTPMRSIQHIFSFFGGAKPPFLNLEFNSYGTANNQVGNVYSLYFSLYPRFGYLGAMIWLIFYGSATTFLYLKAKAGNVVWMIVSGYLFSAMVLSLFSDLFLTSLWFFIKLILSLMLLQKGLSVFNRTICIRGDHRFFRN